MRTGQGAVYWNLPQNELCRTTNALPEISDAHYVFLTRHCKRPLIFPYASIEMYGTNCFSVQPKSGKDRNEKIVQDYSEAHHKLCFTYEIKIFTVYL